MTDDLDVIHEALADQGYYLDPGLRDEFTSDQLAALERGLAASDVPTYVVVYPLRENDAYSGSGVDLITRLHDRYPEPGVYLSTSSRLASTEYSSIRLEGRQYDVPGERDGDLSDFDLLYAVAAENPADLGAAFVRAVELHNAGPEAIEQAYEAASEAADEADDYRSSTGDGSPEDAPAPAGEVAVAVVTVLVVVAVVAWVVVRLRRSRRHRVARRRPDPLGLSPAALDRIREARDRRWETEARAEVLALGTAVDRVTTDHESSRELWAIAQSYYVAARDLLEAPADQHRVLDVVGALVLARRGQAALEAIHSRRDHASPPTCFHHPLHPAPRGRYAAAGADTDVPLCADCRAAGAEGRVPDVLEVERGRDRSVPYYETDAEPWASTGYGALDDDLLGALARARG